MKFKVLHGNYIAGERGNRVTYKAGDIIESDKDLTKIRNKFERIEEPRESKAMCLESTETNDIPQEGVEPQTQPPIISRTRAKRTR